jgi:cell division protein FtsB
MCGRVPTNEAQSESRRRPGTKDRVKERTNQSALSRRLVHWLLLFAAAFIIVNGLVGERGLLAMLRAQQEYDQLSAEISRQRAENARLREQVRRLTEDPGAIEEIARRELGLIRPGERVFIIKDLPPGTGTP